MIVSHVSICSKKLLLAVKQADQVKVEQWYKHISAHSLCALQEDLFNDSLKKAFYINLYNAYFQLNAAKMNPKKIFTERFIHFRDIHISLDQIEHGFLRKYNWKFGLGYLSTWSKKKAVCNMAVSNLDPRIHFALNCGKGGCPLIRVYSPDTIEEDLENATKWFIESTTKIDHHKQVIYCSRLFFWYLGDFGGISGVKKWLGHYLQGSFKRYSVRFTRFDRTDKLKAYY